jgi:hypothetical protein
LGVSTFRVVYAINSVVFIHFLRDFVQAPGGAAGFSALSCYPQSPLRRQGASKQLIVSNFFGINMSPDIVAHLLFFIEDSPEKRRKVEEGTKRHELSE